MIDAFGLLLVALVHRIDPDVARQAVRSAATVAGSSRSDIGGAHKLASAAGCTDGKPRSTPAAHTRTPQTPPKLASASTVSSRPPTTMPSQPRGARTRSGGRQRSGAAADSPPYTA